MGLEILKYTNPLFTNYIKILISNSRKFKINLNNLIIFDNFYFYKLKCYICSFILHVFFIYYL